MVTVNRKSRRASKAIAKSAQVKVDSVKSNPVKDKSNANPQPKVAPSKTVSDRIAALGDNIRPFLTALSATLSDISTDSMKYTALSDNRALDLLLGVYAARDAVEPKLSSMARGITGTSANAVQSAWLQTWSGTYADNMIAAARKLEGFKGDWAARQRAEEAIDAAAAAMEAERVAFNRVVLAAYWLQHLKAEEVGTAKKGKTRGLTCFYTDDEGARTAGHFSVTALTREGRALVAREKAKESGQPAPQKAAGTEKPAKEASKPRATGEGASIVATLETMTEQFRDLTPKARETVLKSDAFELDLAAMIAVKFVPNKVTVANAKKSLDLGAVVAWIRNHNSFRDFDFIEVPVTVQPEVAAEAIKPNGKKASAAK